ncbi:hypothetical protein Hbl1158_11680 [Halobaculum sp. CBA1158]|uniref:hypothetical protein n=1 Tax=Halobaculum sp. CBA1158 TaxID=2904243 RepID=UPI001F2E9725|nr:hypothetical protein [Halobaculum sp. CBA1158]UIO99187.1 hypothetical protein Hbl1158_11680 [Halobaculum sp. CBA1158]
MRGGVRITRRTVLIALVALLAFSGAGLGLVGPELGFTPLEDSTDSVSATPSESPSPPPVTVTPPATSTSAPDAETADGDDGMVDDNNGITETTGTTTATASATTATPGPLTATGTANATDSSDRDGDGSDTDGESGEPDGDTGSDAGGGNDAPALSPTMSLSASSPSDVRNPTGSVSSVEGVVTARATWTGEVDSVVFVVSARTPDGNWVEIDRGATRTVDGSATLASALDRSSFTYVDAANASALDNPENGSTVTRTGSVAVTAVFFADGSPVGEVNRVATYSFEVVNTGPVNLETSTRTSRGLTVDDAAPGVVTERRLTVRNPGDADGVLELAFENRSAAENGLAEPERPVDRAGVVELRRQLSVRVSVTTPDADGGRTYLVGGPDEFIAYTTVGDALGSVDLQAGRERTVIVEWRVPRSAGNEIMTDVVTFDLRATLTVDGTA